MTQPRSAFDSPYSDLLGDLEHRVIIRENERPFPTTGITDDCTSTCVSCDTCTCTCIACDEGGSFPSPGGGVIDPGGGIIRPGF